MIGLTLLQEEYLNQSIRLAGILQKNLVQNLNRKDRSVRQDVFWVLHHSYMPSVLIELGFLTNNTEGPYLNSKKGRKEMAQEIAKSILEYKSDIDFIDKLKVHDSDQYNDNSIVNAKIDSTIQFKVQISASSRKLATKPYNFNGLKSISREKKMGLFRYFYGETKDYSTAKELQKKAVSYGYEQAYIVAFKDGKRVSLKEVLNKNSE